MILREGGGVYHYPTEGAGGNGAKAFQCSACGGLITHSDRLISFGGKNRHVFVNPAGVECDFHTFTACQGAIAFGEPTEEHSWFSGYSWRVAFCRQCGQHLGWFYEGVTSSRRPQGFWGLLVSRIVIQQGADGLLPCSPRRDRQSPVPVIRRKGQT